MISSLRLAAATLVFTAMTAFCTPVSFTSKTLAVVQTMSYDFKDVNHPGGVLFTVSGMPTGISRFIIRENDSSLDRHLALLLKAKELGKTVSFVYDVDPLNATNGVVTTIWIN
ncbi:MAG: hypothetical protein JWP91_3098 [Fibrobacteres bacterium]|nr:hypothetical protein [Fibrobacterota bacterium]